jgi:Neuraminidase (sialidase)
MSVEGDRIVVAWQSGESNQAWQPFDIYYATSKDGGQTWAKPLKVTDRAKDGLTSARPQVAVQNGIIHLFYVQGKEDRHAQVWNQGGWPVYYQQRPFPN